MELFNHQYSQTSFQSQSSGVVVFVAFFCRVCRWAFQRIWNIAKSMRECENIDICVFVVYTFQGEIIYSTYVAAGTSSFLD